MKETQKKQRTDSGKAVLIIGLFGLIFVLGVIFIEYFAYQSVHEYTPQEIAATTQAIDINCASAEQLEQIPGLSKEKALNIVAYREEHGKFTTVDDLLDVKGIGRSTLDKIRLYITV